MNFRKMHLLLLDYNCACYYLGKEKTFDKDKKNSDFILCTVFQSLKTFFFQIQVILF